jgi:hypothetical protein
MVASAAQSLMLGGAKMAVEQVSLDPAAWTALAARGFVTMEPLNAHGPAVVVTISAEGRAANLREARG